MAFNRILRLEHVHGDKLRAGVCGGNHRREMGCKLGQSRAIFSDMKQRYLCTDMAEVESAPRTHHKSFDHNSGYEILCACIIAKAFPGEDGVLPRLALPTRDSYRSGDVGGVSSLWATLDNLGIADEDSDFGLSFGDGLVFPFQVTQLVAIKPILDALDLMKKTLSRKMTVQPDEVLQLIVLCDETFDFRPRDVTVWLSDQQVPFGQIKMIAQVGNEPRFGEFKCFQLYPEFMEGPVVQIDLTSTA